MVQTLESIGQKLKNLREKKGISLDVISQKSNLKKDFILSLEREEFDKLPTLIHARGFLKTYTQILGAPSEEFLKEFDKISSQKSEKTILPNQSKLQNDKSLEDKKHLLWFIYEYKKQWIIGGIFLFFLLAIYIFGTFLSFLFHKRDVFLSFFEKKSSVVLPLESTNLFEKEGNIKDVSAKKSMTRQSYSPIDPRQNLILKAFFLEKSWISIKNDKQLLYEGFVEKGSNEIWTAKKTLVIKMSNSQNISFHLNDKSLDEVNHFKNGLSRIRITHTMIEFE